MPAKVSSYRSGEPRFGTRSGKDYVNGEVKTYRLSDEELQKLRKETGYMPLTKEKYMELKAAGKTDKVIMQEFNLNPVNLNKLKNRWGLIGVYGKRPEKIAEKAKEVANIRIDNVADIITDNIIEAMNWIPYHEQGPTSDNQFRKIALSIAETLERKNHDYGDSFGKLYRKFGDLSAIIRLTDKLERYESLITKKQQVTDESINDTLMDLAGYAILTIVARKKL
jgi:hypothetical protein